MALLRLTTGLLLAATLSSSVPDPIAQDPNAQDPIRAAFTELAGFDYKEGMTLPAEVTKLDEKVVTINGFMRREFPGVGPVNSFLLINDACGCDGTPMIHEIVFCMLPDGVTMDIKPGVVEVTGKLYVGEEKEDGVVIMLYQMDADTVK